MFHGDDRLDIGADGLISAYRCLYDNDLVLRQIHGSDRRGRRRVSAAVGSTRKPASQRRAEILDAAAVRVRPDRAGRHGPGDDRGARRDQPSADLQMFGTKHALFLAVLEDTFDRIEQVFQDTASSARGDDPSVLERLAEAYLRLLRRNRTVGPLMLQGFAAADDESVRELVKHRYQALQRLTAALAAADPMQVRSLFATGLVVTVSTVLELPGARTDVRARWLLELPTSQPDAASPIATTSNKETGDASRNRG